MSCVFCGYFKRVLFGELIVLDEAGNVLIPDSNKEDSYVQNGHITISQHLARLREEGSKVGIIGCKTLTWVQNKIFRIPGDHCTNSLVGFPPNLPTDG